MKNIYGVCVLHRQIRYVGFFLVLFISQVQWLASMELDVFAGFDYTCGDEGSVRVGKSDQGKHTLERMDSRASIVADCWEAPLTRDGIMDVIGGFREGNGTAAELAVVLSPGKVAAVGLSSEEKNKTLSMLTLDLYVAVAAIAKELTPVGSFPAITEEQVEALAEQQKGVAVLHRAFGQKYVLPGKHRSNLLKIIQAADQQGIDTSALRATVRKKALLSRFVRLNKKYLARKVRSKVRDSERLH